MIEALCEGFTDTEIAGRAEQEIGVELTRQSVSFYRQQNQAIIDEAEAQAVRELQATGWGRRSHRARKLASKLGKLEEALETYGPGQWGQMSKDMLAFLQELRKELGQEHPLLVKVEGEIEHRFADGLTLDELIRLARLHDRTRTEGGLPEEGAAGGGGGD